MNKNIQIHKFEESGTYTVMKSKLQRSIDNSNVVYSSIGTPLTELKREVSSVDEGTEFTLKHQKEEYLYFIRFTMAGKHIKSATLQLSSSQKEYGFKVDFSQYDGYNTKKVRF